MKATQRIVVFIFIVVGIVIGIGFTETRAYSAAEAPKASGGRVDEFEQIEEGDDSANSSVETESESEAVKPETKPRKGSTRAKEAEGSKAPNRFQADVVTKSSYKLSGEPLEVDPD